MAGFLGSMKVSAEGRTCIMKLISYKMEINEAGNGDTA
jgi:hypothetical protein